MVGLAIFSRIFCYLSVHSFFLLLNLSYSYIPIRLIVLYDLCYYCPLGRIYKRKKLIDLTIKNLSTNNWTLPFFKPGEKLPIILKEEV